MGAIGPSSSGERFWGAERDKIYLYSSILSIWAQYRWDLYDIFIFAQISGQIKAGLFPESQEKKPKNRAVFQEICILLKNRLKIARLSGKMTEKYPTLRMKGRSLLYGLSPYKVALNSSFCCIKLLIFPNLSIDIKFVPKICAVYFTRK
ncbi:MAG: hypothetical protein HFF14_09195 [Angelakisella sp.]|nr:hypothetical protein [Angelakisella sp.]